MVAKETMEGEMENKSLGRLISIIYRHQNIILNHKFEKFGIGSGQYSYFMAVANSEGINQGQISKALKVNKATTNKAIKKLEELGYVETIIDEDDRRLHCVYLTEEGSLILPDVKKELKDYTDKLGRGLTEEVKSILLNSLEIMESNVKEYVDQIREEKLDEK